MVQQFGSQIWLADGPVVTAAAGFHYPTRMAIMRLGNGDLVAWSPVALTDALRAAVDALGPVRHLVPPSTLHDSFVAQWHSAYPDAAVYAPPALRDRRPDIVFTADLADAPPPAWGDEIDLVIMRGNRITTEVVFFHRPSGTAIFTDLLQQLPPGWFRGWRSLIARLDLMVGPEPSVPRKFRVAFTDRQAARTAIDRVLAWPVRQVLMAHGTPVTTDASAFLRRAFGWLLR